jgi:hypothetical protein
MMSANPALSGSYAPSEGERSVSTAIAASYAGLDLTGCIAARIFEPFLNPRTEGIRMGLSIIHSGMGSQADADPSGRGPSRCCSNSPDRSTLTMHPD